MTGATDACEVEFGHEMTVRRIYESPRVTKPYTEEQWRAIDACGHDVDRELSSGDVRLTMGGEPTFVSIDDVDGAEWNLTALGPRKRGLAGILIRRLKQQFAPGGLLHFGQGKWYPGESLPRWTLGCWWRRDGVPIWKDDSLVADETVDYGHDEAQAKRFIMALADRLGVGPQHAIPAYEDVWHYLWRERRLPVNVDPLKSELKDEEERTRLSRIFEQGLDRVVGYVLPLHRIHDPNPGAYWASGAWFLRSEHLFLIPGDSPIGYRLPLDSLPWVAPDEYPHIYEADPFAPAPPLPPRQQYLHAPAGAVRARGAVAAQALPKAGESAAGIVRTALCVEPRHGRLHVFMPPVRSMEDYLDLVAAIEETASTLKMPVVIEGTPPPSDCRLNHFRITPDPGVIEVNMHPAHSWDELVTQTTVLYDEARLSRLGTEKFMLDGRHTGTGGGNHIVIGGPTPADSPILRRPDLLRSLVGYWHNHPSMSYLFSGLFLGPTSQHPRVDEARNDSIHELEIAFARLGDRDGTLPPPWLVDRLFRNLLIDVTGNTHRAEFCIDKLYDPDSSSGRQGLVELRAFEMPPHARMSLTQQLLLRALIAWFWKTPYNQSLVRWGTDLHDRFMLPHFVAQDFDDVVADLRRSGYGLETAWFAPHLEFRFPLYGTVTRRGVHLELRQALEPWHVMGEEAGAGGTVRYVDSSVERLQVKVTGLTGSRHVITCNGRRVPLHPTGTVGEFVAGVRYRAWQPPSGLHPTIPVQAPLVFDILDTWNQRSMGGCVYHVTHPGGRNFEVFPVNAYEAESRRLARFFDIGHTAGPVSDPPEERDRDFPLTLDLRDSAESVGGTRMKSATDIHGVTTPWRLFEGYHPLEGAYDEMVAAPGVLRPHCEGFVRSLEALGQHEFASRWEGAKRSIRENGVTYNIYGDPQGVDRPWELDMVPLLISPAEWARLETALIQRTTLLNLILADLYGPQTLLGAGLLPPSLVFSNPALPAAVPRHSRPAGDSPAPARAWTWRARPTVNGGCSPIGRRRRRAPGMRSKTGSCCCAACPKRSAIVRCTGWPRSFARSATR